MTVFLRQRTDLLSWSDEEDSDLSGYSWIDEELPEEVNVGEDPDYVIKESYGCAAYGGRKYELRPRLHRTA